MKLEISRAALNKELVAVLTRQTVLTMHCLGLGLYEHHLHDQTSLVEPCFAHWVSCPPATIQIVVHLTNMKYGAFTHVMPTLNYNDLEVLYYFIVKVYLDCLTDEMPFHRSTSKVPALGVRSCH